MRRLPREKSDYYPLSGGLDLVTPHISIPPGKVIDAQNYEPTIAGGYRRIDGYERFDGQASPTAASYWILNQTTSGTIAVGNTVTGATSTAHGVVLGIFTGYLVLGRVSGAFVLGENLTIAAVIVGVTTSLSLQDGALWPSDHADYRLLSANDQRQFILTVPGSGPVQGVKLYNDVVYAFRNNVGGTASVMYKSTAAGWVLVPFLTELRFTSAVAQIAIGATITGGTSGATARVVNTLLTTGTWTVSGVGSLILDTVVGTFTAGEAIQVGGVTKVTAAYNSALITRLPGGKYQMFNFNFTAQTSNLRMYGVDGVNTAFEFYIDATYGPLFSPIRTGMVNDTPQEIVCHRTFLFLAFLGSIQFSGISNPYAWTIVLGAGEFDVGTTCTGFLPQGGNYYSGSTLAIFAKGNTYVLYGTTSADFKLVTSVFDVGASAFTAQQVSNDAYAMTTRGIQSLVSTLQFGDFDYDSVSHLIQPLITKKMGLEISSNVIKTKNQYRVYFSDGTAIAVGLTGQTVSGLMPLYYQDVVRCICSDTLSTGKEVTFFGTDSGYVMQDNTGTSQDGQQIESWVRLPFNNLQSPMVRKRFTRAALEVTVDSYSQVNVSYDLGYGSYQINPSQTIADQILIGPGGYWDQFTWDQFSWDTQMVSNPVIPLDGTEKNIGFLFYSNRTQDNAHTLQGLTVNSLPRRLER